MGISRTEEPNKRRSTPPKTPDFGQILADGFGVPTPDSSADMGSLDPASLQHIVENIGNKYQSKTPKSAPDSGDSISTQSRSKDADLENALDSARNAADSMAYSPQKQEALGIIDNANNKSFAAIIQAAQLVAEKESELKLRTNSTTNDLANIAARQREAEDRRMYELRQRAYLNINALFEKGYIGEEDKKKLDEQKSAIDAAQARLKKLQEKDQLTAPEQAELKQLQQQLPEQLIAHAETGIAIAQKAGERATAQGDDEAIENARIAKEAFEGLTALNQNYAAKPVEHERMPVKTSSSKVFKQEILDGIIKSIPKASIALTETSIDHSITLAPNIPQQVKEGGKADKPPSIAF
jgi:hypothetical protein